MGKIYFASDFHLGAPHQQASREREQRIIRWLDEIKKDAEALFLVGDIFDFWFEYTHLAPKGYIRFLAKLAELRAQGIEITLFTGNHDMWLGNYLKEELDISIYYQPKSYTLKGKTFYIGHGDGLGPGDLSFKIMRKVFHSKVFQWIFARFHPNFSFGIAHFWSQSSRKQKRGRPTFRGNEKEYLIVYTERKVTESYHDFFVFGHRHLPIDHTLHNQQSRYINLGEWIFNRSYAVYDGKTMEIRFFENENGTLANRND